jgi:hypothetical protein
MGEHHEEDPLAWCGIREADPAGEAGTTICDVTSRTSRAQLRIVKAKEGRERLVRQCRNLETHWSTRKRRSV